MRRPLLTLLLALTLITTRAPSAAASETPAEHAANIYAAQELAQAPAGGNLPDYSLPPDKLAKAQHLQTIRTAMNFGGTLWSLLQFVLLLWLGVIAWIRNRALASSASQRSKGRTTRAFWRECIVFTVLYTAISSLLDLPLSLYHQHLARTYGFSVQSWAGWWGDFAKSFGLGLLGGFLFFALLMWLIRKLPRSWWLVGWAVVAPLLLFLVYLSPYVIDPLFNKFEPLQQSQPELVARLEQVVAKGHMNIPPERMFLMKASAKVTTLNAYVTGFGASKRVVVWDTSLQKGTPDQVLFIFGHESGHYVLGHIVRGMIFLVVRPLALPFRRLSPGTLGPSPLRLCLGHPRAVRLGHSCRVDVRLCAAQRRPATACQHPQPLAGTRRRRLRPGSHPRACGRSAGSRTLGLCPPWYEQPGHPERKHYS